MQQQYSIFSQSMAEGWFHLARTSYYSPKGVTLHHMDLPLDAPLILLVDELGGGLNVFVA